MDLEGVVPLECCRLVKYDEFHEYLERSYEGEEDTPMGLLLGGVKSSYMFDLLLETRRPEQVFQPYKPGGKGPRMEHYNTMQYNAIQCHSLPAIQTRTSVLPVSV